MKKIYVFDFDGTLTTRDTLLQFILYVWGRRTFCIGLLCYSPLLVLMKLGVYPNWKAKQKVFAHFFKGMTLEKFNDWGRRFAESAHHLLREKGLEMLRQAQAEGSEVVIVSASIDNWVQPFFTGQSGIPEVKVLGTQVEVENGRLTGRFLTKNCYGQEKVNRMLVLYPNRSEYKLIAFGDSRGDKEMLAFADEAYYKPFRV